MKPLPIAYRLLAALLAASPFLAAQDRTGTEQQVSLAGGAELGGWLQLAAGGPHRLTVRAVEAPILVTVFDHTGAVLGEHTVRCDAGHANVPIRTDIDGTYLVLKNLGAATTSFAVQVR
ncbi:MAG: hypothetical protein U1E73_06260 [Planctomycetota bacterium]